MPYSPPSKPSSDKSGRAAYVYLDESNFKISGEKAEEKRRRPEPKKHLDWHYDIRALKGIVRKVPGMKVNEEVTLSVYGSNLHRGRVYQDLVLHSSRLFNFDRKGKEGEKKVDTNLVRDMSLDATHLTKSNKTNVFVLVSGDSDMIPAVEYALECDYNVHVFAWQDSVSDEYKELARKDLIELTLLANFLVTLTMARPSVHMRKLLFPRNCVVLLNPWHVVGQLGDKLVSSNMYLIQSLNDGSRPHNDVVVLPHKRVRDPDIRLRFMLEDFKEKGLNVMTLAEYSLSSHQIKLFGS
ncbi:hypothetical protein BFJ72_g3609 [Fusarium proliferatum]|uniref:NYN domain-containing protein n=1 Tax=Gibberella intermedia TaxID=948311 RepID=A0A420TTW1_GIBIN|nr:hypothetical protein BFJ72_g3609 [Fusarium proliferatum]